MTLIRNAVRCHRCGTVAESTHVHHMARCKCGAVAADGGPEYQRRVHRAGATWDELSVHDDDAHVEAWEIEQWRRGAEAEAQLEELRAKVLAFWLRHGR